MKLSLTLVSVIWSLALALGTTDASTSPEQVHISLGTTETEMVVTWSTLQPISDQGEVLFGEHSDQLTNRAKAEVVKFQHFIYTYRALMTGLTPGTNYHYKVGSTASSWSKVFNFRTLKAGPNWNPRVAIYGDLGFQNDRTLPYLSKEVEQGVYDTIFHIGDMAYDLQERDAKQGNDFINSIEPVAANCPYMTCPGNHEQHQNFSHYDARFTMIGDRHKPDHNSPLTHRMNNHFWSIDIGPAHFLLFSTEYYYYTEYGWDQIERQFRFMEEDLKRANANRAERPWIIAMGHKPLYCSNVRDINNQKSQERAPVRNGVHMHGNVTKGLQYGLEDLFYKNGVDLQFYGHEHSYARLLPIYQFKIQHGSNTTNQYHNPGGPVHITTGSPGNREINHAFNPKLPDWIVSRSMDYGYTRMTFKDRQHILVEQLSDNKGGKVIDSVEISKDQDKPAWIH